MAQGGKNTRRLPHGAHAVAVDLDPARRAAGEGDAKGSRVRAHLIEKRADGRGCAAGISGHRSRGGIQQGGAVPHQPGQCVLDHQTAVEIPEFEAERVPGARGLEAEEAATRGRDPD
jgi:hypothetical protein